MRWVKLYLTIVGAILTAHMFINAISYVVPRTFVLGKGFWDWVLIAFGSWG